MAQALDNIKVLDFTRAYSGPFCTMLLKDLGAEIIKIEIPGSGDMVRTTPPRTPGGEGYIFVNLNRGKKSVTLNLTSERGREIGKELVKKGDVVVENFTPGVMDKLGLGYEELKRVNPALIYASLSGFGHTGPRRSEVSFDIVAQAMGGFMSVTGFPDGPPTKAGPTIGDLLGGIYTAVAILASLHYRDRTGTGQHIDMSMQDCVWAVTAIEFAAFYFLTGKVPPRSGNRYLSFSPGGVYPAKDGHVVCGIATVGQWQDFLRVIGREDLVGVEEYATHEERIKRRQEVDALVEGWTKTRSVKEILNALNNAHLLCSSVPTLDEVANDPQLLSREMVIEVEQLISGNLKVPGSVFKLSETPGDVKYPAPFLGEYNYEIYRDLLGYSEQEINKLAEDGVI